MNKINYKIESNILSYKDNILRYLIKYKLKNEGKDLDDSIKLMENIMEDDTIKNSINKKFKKNNIEDILKELNQYNPYIKYCIIIDVEKPTNNFSTGSIIRRRMLTQKGGNKKELSFEGKALYYFVLFISYIITSITIMCYIISQVSFYGTPMKSVYRFFKFKKISESDLRLLIDAIKFLSENGDEMISYIKLPDKSPKKNKYFNILKNYEDLFHLKVHEITNMSSLFKDFNFGEFKEENSKIAYTLITGNTYINLNITQWDVGNVKNMNHMFFNSEGLNQDLSKWNVKNVTNMQGMFCNSNYGNGKRIHFLFKKTKSLRELVADNWFKIIEDKKCVRYSCLGQLEKLYLNSLKYSYSSSFNNS